MQINFVFSLLREEEEEEEEERNVFFVFGSILNYNTRILPNKDVLYLAALKSIKIGFLSQ
jgi:hypothetical protein